MRILCIMALLASHALVLSTAPANSATPVAKVMVMGIAHLVARRDVHNSVFVDSPLSSARQAQISDIVRRLLRFHPTKVLIEAPMGDPVFAERYRQFVAGRFKLPANEIYQFGFTLAALAGNSTIYPIDTQGPNLIDPDRQSGKRVIGFLNAHAASISTPSFKAYSARDDALERNGTYLDLFRYLNSDAAIRANASVYSVIAGAGRNYDNAGGAYVAEWYARNCYIFSNILSVIRPGDRVVVIMGQGHVYLLREFVRLNPTLQYSDPLIYLK